MERYSVELNILGHSLIALLFGGVIGFERGVAGKWAGLRTHMLVCVGAMLLVNVGELLIGHVQNFVRPENTRGEAVQIVLRSDPIRMIEAIMTGVAFLGAGMVFRDPARNVARGLTTAASLLVTASIGIAVAMDRLLLAVGVTLILFFVLFVLGRVEHRWQGAGLSKDERSDTQRPGAE
jgi:putative Mg2+ transporter-C (MgtC) family protein